MGSGGRIVVVLVAGMLLSGSLNTISKKLGYGTCGASPVAGTYPSSEECPGSNTHKFRKPWTQTFVMFCGEAMCILVFLYRRHQAASRRREVQSSQALTEPIADETGAITSVMSPPRFAFTSPTLTRGKEQQAGAAGSSEEFDSRYLNVTWFSPLYCLLPALCDLGGTTVSGIGLLFTSASVFQMLRGSIIFFTAVFSVIFLERRLYAFHYAGLLLTIIGVSLIGFSSIVGASNASDAPGSISPSPSAFSSSPSSAGHIHTTPTPTEVWIGNGLVVVSQLLSATQMVVEEKFLKSKNLPPEFVVGMEGTFGALVAICVVLPVVGVLPGPDGEGIHESALDAAYLVASSPVLLSLVMSYFLSIAIYNFCGLSVAKRLSSVHRCLIDSCRTIVVWGVDLCLYHFTSGRFGERWNPDSSWIQLVGFGILLMGSFIYYKVIRFPCFNTGYALDEGRVVVAAARRAEAFPPAVLRDDARATGDSSLHDRLLPVE